MLLPQCWRGCVQSSGSISKYRECCFIMKCDHTIWLAFSYQSNDRNLFKKCPIFSVFCVFLHKERSVWHYLYIFVNLSKGATPFVNRAKWVAVFLVPWECWPKKEIGDILLSMLLYLLKWSQNLTSYLLSWDIYQTDCGNILL